MSSFCYGILTWQTVYLTCSQIYIYIQKQLVNAQTPQWSEKCVSKIRKLICVSGRFVNIRSIRVLLLVVALETFLFIIIPCKFILKRYSFEVTHKQTSTRVRRLLFKSSKSFRHKCSCGTIREQHNTTSVIRGRFKNLITINSIPFVL